MSAGEERLGKATLEFWERFADREEAVAADVGLTPRQCHAIVNDRTDGIQHLRQGQLPGAYGRPRAPHFPRHGRKYIVFEHGGDMFYSTMNRHRVPSAGVAGKGKSTVGQ